MLHEVIFENQRHLQVNPVVDFGISLRARGQTRCQNSLLGQNFPNFGWGGVVRRMEWYSFSRLLPLQNFVEMNWHLIFAVTDNLHNHGAHGFRFFRDSCAPLPGFYENEIREEGRTVEWYSLNCLFPLSPSAREQRGQFPNCSLWIWHVSALSVVEKPEMIFVKNFLPQTEFPPWACRRGV